MRAEKPPRRPTFADLATVRVVGSTLVLLPAGPVRR